ncbi:phosphoadenosine phosphosulfate reductase domain-containing protein [Tenacibaculum jejuense]|uniref:Putative 3'-phosphoadenosine 5'-phosphosulfate sulfotransferase n=1 Tax=Tenacibaculum jejuense TaxID=584609 RepID=A0A238UDL9_9FLAO|nr:phosphoadenosine phosphosulfate reductase family protein [Tenacibaculum jejuense]SNR17172.1 putative 3'-phosphoadenosine 5'-phosphosulfate sulfotransferase [Tenacibaculum jejuense]
MNIEEINKELKGKSPQEIVSWALSVAKKPVVTTNFRPYESAILHLVVTEQKDIPVVWCDTGYNTPQTYKHAEELIEKLSLDVKLYVPKQTVAHRNVVLGLPSVDDPNHAVFTEQVKLEPFKRAMNEHQPDVWFTNLRKGQTAFRDSIDIVSVSKDGILKVSPFYNFSDEDLDQYLAKFDLPNEFKYFDPTKVESNRECGLHI